MHSRPVTRQYRGPQMAPVGTHTSSGENLTDLIVEVDVIREDLGYPRWSSLRAWCDEGDPCTTDRGGLERLLERLCIVWEGRDHANG